MRGRVLELTKWAEERREIFNTRDTGEGAGVNFEELKSRDRASQLLER